MADTVYTVPDIYPEFRCKISSCRQTCCYGWEITLSMEEYFRLIGMNCPHALRHRLDGTVYILDHPTKERYAAFAKRYDGECPMHDSDGFCALQRGCGEKALTSVCRFYPRSPRTHHAAECSVAASCEGACELLFAKKEPLSFIKMPLSFDGVFTPPQDDDRETRFYVPIRKKVVALLQNREKPLESRINDVVSLCEKLSAVFPSGTDENINDVLSDNISVGSSATEVDEKALNVAAKFLSGFDFRHSVYPFVQKAGENLAFGTEAFYENYQKAKVLFEHAFPEWERMFEQVLVNHVFYEGFPFSDNGCTMYDNSKAFCAIYGMWRLAAVGYTLSSPEINSLVDVTAAFFRLAENSRLPDSIAKAMQGKGELATLDFASI